jgi:hypothetical protein
MTGNRLCDIFISYSKDSGSRAAEQLASEIEKRDLKAFAFEYTLASGRSWDEQVLDALRYSRCVLVLVPTRKKRLLDYFISASEKRLTDYMNHEIGIARVLKKIIVPVALGGDFTSSAPMSPILSQYWGRPFDQLLSNLDLFLRDIEIDTAARRTSVWSQYLVSDSVRIVVGGIDPSSLQDQAQVRAGAYLSIGTSRSITRLLCFFSQEFGADFADKLLIAQNLNDDEISRHDLIVLGGPQSFHNSPLRAYHVQLGIRYDGAQRAYLVGPREHRVAIESEQTGVTKEGCVLALAHNPMNLQKEMLLVSAVSGYGGQGAIEYLVDGQIASELAVTINQWRGGSHDTPLLFDLSTKFKGSTYVRGSGTARQVEGDPVR